MDPALGFSLGYTYWFKYIIVTPNQLTAAALVIQYWCPPEQVNPGVFITVFLIAIVTINYLGIRFFGEIEFWLSSIKVLTILGLLLLGIIIAAGGVPGSPATGFKCKRHCSNAFDIADTPKTTTTLARSPHIREPEIWDASLHFTIR